MSVAWPRRDVHETARLAHLDSVPYALWYEDRLARAQRLDALGADRLLVSAVLHDHVNATRHEIEQLVTIRVHLATMRRVAREKGRADGETVDAHGSSGFGVDDARRAVATQRRNGCCQVE